MGNGEEFLKIGDRFVHTYAQGLNIEFSFVSNAISLSLRIVTTCNQHSDSLIARKNDEIMLFARGWFGEGLSPGNEGKAFQNIHSN